MLGQIYMDNETANIDATKKVNVKVHMWAIKEKA